MSEETWILSRKYGEHRKIVCASQSEQEPFCRPEISRLVEGQYCRPTQTALARRKPPKPGKLLLRLGGPGHFGPVLDSKQYEPRPMTDPDGFTPATIRSARKLAESDQDPTKWGATKIVATVKLRRGDGWQVKPEAELVDGRRHTFTYGWEIEAEDSSVYVDESAWVPERQDWPAEAPAWIASGDLDEIKPLSR